MIDTHDDAVLVGYCHGSFLQPDSDGSCPTCQRQAGFVRGLCGPHVLDPGPVNIWVDTGYEGKVDCYRAYNGPPGLLIAQPTDWIFDEWWVLHTMTGAPIHSSTYVFPPDVARSVAARVAGETDWLSDPEELMNDEALAERVNAIWYLAWLGKDPDEWEAN